MSEEKDHKVIVKPDVKDGKLIISYGEEPVYQAPVKLSINGNIYSVTEFLEHRKDEIDRKKAYVVFNNDDRVIRLILNEDCPLTRGSVLGSLKLSSKYNELGINSDKTWSPFKLADYIRMNRSYFESKEVAADLVIKLRDFKARVDRQIELHKDDRANMTALRKQAVDTNLPEGFTVNIPLFVGMDRIKFHVEISIDPETLNCSLVSPDAADMIDEQTTEILKNEEKEIRELVPELPIIFE